MTDPHPKTALILVDVINSFFDPRHPNHYPAALEVLEPMRRLRARARDTGAVVVHAVERHRPGFVDYEWQRLPVHHLYGDQDAAFLAVIFPASANS